MADLQTQKYHKHIFPDLNITLKRFYTRESPDKVGTLEMWKEGLDDLYNQMPFPDFWKDMVLEIWDMKSPDLISKTNATLLDFDLHTPGNQTAAGLYFNGDSKRLALGVFSGNYFGARDTMSHEIGHMYGDISDLFEGKAGISTILTKWFEDNRPHQTSNLHEDFAETYRAILGGVQSRGTFSDRKKYTPPPEMYTFMRTAFWLAANLKNTIVSDFSIKGSYCQWLEWYKFGWVQYPRKWYALTNNWDKFAWENGKWVSV
jgi:hypothetical protein